MPAINHTATHIHRCGSKLIGRIVSPEWTPPLGPPCSGVSCELFQLSFVAQFLEPSTRLGLVLCRQNFVPLAVPNLGNDDDGFGLLVLGIQLFLRGLWTAKIPRVRSELVGSRVFGGGRGRNRNQATSTYTEQLERHLAS
jgi:hypothetical protein